MNNSFTVSELSKICEAEVLQMTDDHPVHSLITDSRKISNVQEAAFFAIKGPNHDGHSFIHELLNAGIKTIFIESPIGQPFPATANILKVNSSLKALQMLASYKRQHFNRAVVGITGSNGKTIVKEWLSKMLSQKLQVVKSPRSYNSQLGVPLSVWELDNTFDIGVFEAGISQPGEMEVLQSIIKPTHGIFTNIGTAHEEGFESMREKLREKLKLFHNCDWLIYSADNPLVEEEITATTWQETNLFSWSFNEQAELKVRKGQIGYYHLSWRQEEFQLRFPFNDPASVENLMHCICHMLINDFEPKEIQEALDTLEPVDMRLKLHKGINHTYIIDDSYNNDLAGLETALDFLHHQRQFGKKTLILSDFPQVKNPAEHYAEVNRLVKSRSIDRLIGIGPEITNNSSQFHLPCEFFQSTADFLNSTKSLDFHEEVILVKGARKLHFEKIVKQLSEKVHRTVFEINLDAITHNLNYYRNLLNPGVKTMVMVKAFAYGSGIAEVAQLLQFHKVHYLSVAYADEGVTLRQNGIHLPIMVMNTDDTDFDTLIDHKLEPEIFSVDQLKDFSLAYAKRGEPLPAHININTGMNRLGFEPEEMDLLAQSLRATDHVEVKSIFTHLAGADEEEHNVFSIQQLEAFKEAAKILEETIGKSLLKHALNSAGIQRFPGYQFDMVRLGIGLYGLEASGMHSDKLMTVGILKTVISQVKHIRQGQTIGYGRKGVANKDMTIATVAIGYADGYSRAFSNGVGAMLVNGKTAPVIGNVCMDMTMLDITGINAQAGDQVIVFGESPTISDLAEEINTIPYEILTNVSERVKRIYITE